MPDDETRSFYHCILAARRDLTPPTQPRTLRASDRCLISQGAPARNAEKFPRNNAAPSFDRSLLSLIAPRRGHGKCADYRPIASSVGAANNAIVEAACCPSGGNLDQSVRPDRARRDRHRLLARHRPRHRRTTGRTWRDGHHLIAQSRRLRRDCGRHQSRARARGGETDPGQHFVQGGASAPGRRDEQGLWPDRHSGVQRGVKSLLRADGRYFGRSIPQDSREQRPRQPLVDPDGRARHAGAQRRLDRHHLFDRRASRARP